MKSKSSRRTKPAASPKDGDSPSPEHKNDLLIAAIGASAGGIEAFTEFVSNLPKDTGMTFALDEASAKYASMPVSAVAAGCVDYVLPPRAIAHELARIARHPYLARAEAADIAPAENTGLTLVFKLLRKTTGVDFTHYRQSTILRRIHRRMVVHKIDRLDEYVKHLQSNPPELKALYRDMLINVTSFFRNPRAFDALKSHVFPAILKNHPPEASIRIWTPGCASGEETYSVAIALLEFLGDKSSQANIQFFGTDVSESSIAKARAGSYPENITADVSPERLRRFFTKVEGRYRVTKNIRDMCIFAQHNILNDPPFSQMDLIACRNLLIYLEPVLQNKAISLFHYALRPGGYLLLGASEGVGTAGHLFSTEDGANKIFLKKATSVRQPVTFSMHHHAERVQDEPLRVPAKLDSSWNYLEAQKEFDRRLLSQYSPATVFINEDMEIIHTRGGVNRFLKLAPGRPSLSIMKMAREGLLPDLRSAIAKARKENVTVRKHNIQIKDGNGNGAPRSDSERLVNFEVVPVNLGSLKELYFMIVFADSPVIPRPAPASRSARAERESQVVSGKITRLEQELAATKEYLQSVIETQQATNEELQSANEEILSSNEELQSTNEELETAKEELQSANEELSTVNDELRSRNLEVNQINNDLTNLFASIYFAVVMVGSDLTIRRFTPQAQKFLGLIPADVGRPLSNINPPVEVPDLQSLVLQVMATSAQVDREFADRLGGRYQVRILPYRTLDNKIDGAVITFVDISNRALGESG